MRSIHFCRQKSFWWQWFLFLRTVDASFQFYGQLEHVDFSYNQMTELPDKCFAKQSKLKHLQMDFNSIGNITNQTFLGLKSLTYLSLRGNKLSNLNEELAALTEVIHTYILISMFHCWKQQWSDKRNLMNWFHTNKVGSYICIYYLLLSLIQN